jgi:hypothetical protein
MRVRPHLFGWLLSAALLLAASSRARAEVAVQRPIADAASPEERLAQETVLAGLADAGIQTVSAADAKARLIAAAENPCLEVDCAGSLLRALGADMLVATLLGRNGGQLVDVVVQLIDIEGRYVHATSAIKAGDVATAARAALAQALSRWPARALIAVHIEGTPEGATVMVDGQPKGTLPLEVRLQPGKHVVTVASDGYERAERTLRVEATRGDVTERIDLIALGASRRPRERRVLADWLTGLALVAVSAPYAASGVYSLVRDGDCAERARVDGVTGCSRSYTMDGGAWSRLVLGGVGVIAGAAVVGWAPIGAVIRNDQHGVTAIVSYHKEFF